VSEIARRIKMRREELGLTTEDLANRMGYKDRSSISKIENGKADIPQSKVIAFAHALHTTTAYLIGIDEEKEEKVIPPGFMPLPETYKVPLVGRIACGQPITAEENIEDYMDVPKGKLVDFCLRCEGDSMIDAGIDDGDVVYIRKQATIENGEIAAIRIGDEATLKKFYLHDDFIELRPANTAYQSIIRRREDMNDICIEGKAIGWTHWV